MTKDLIPGVDFPTRKAYKFDDDAMGRFLTNYMMNGQIHSSCQAAGISEECFRQYIKHNHNNFRTMFEEAKGLFRDMIEAEVQRRAIHGIDEPIIGGKDRDQVVTVIKRYSDRLLEFYAKRHIPEYREHQQLDVSVSGGVMVVPGRPKDQVDWSEQYGEIPRPTDEKTDP